MVQKLQPLKHGARQDSAIALTSESSSGNSESDGSSNESGDISKSASSDDCEDSVSQDNLSDREVAHKEKEKKRKQSKDGKKGKEDTRDKKKKKHAGPKDKDNRQERENQKKEKRRCVHKSHVVQMVRDYQIHIAAYTKTKGNKAPLQLIPGKVWKKIYADYLKHYSDSPFEESTLRDHLRVHLKELKANEANPGVGQSVAVEEDPDLMSKLMATDSWKARNILKIREEAVQGKAKNSPSTTMGPTDGGSNEGESASLATEPAGSAPPTPAPKKPATKAENLKATRDNMVALVKEFTTAKKDRLLEMEMKRARDKAKEEYLETKKQESEAKKKFQEQQNVMAAVNLLKEAKNLGLISEEDL
ncbi:unnamed protein product [Calypogeia fissa]